MKSSTNRFNPSAQARHFVLVLAAGCALGIAGVGEAHAAEAPQIAVSYQDLDLSRPADAKLLYRRLQEAASTVCEPVSAEELARHLAFKRCYEAALDHAVVQINAPQLLAVHSAQTGNAPGQG
jgi:UrcA family protein